MRGVDTKRNRYNKGLRREILEVIMLCGAVPYKSMHLLNLNIRCVKDKILDLSKENIITVDKKRGNWTIYLQATSEVQELMERNMDKTYWEYYQQYGKHDGYKVKGRWEKKAKRILANSDVILFYRGININTSPLKESLENYPKINTYYTLRDIRNYMTENNPSISGTDLSVSEYSRINGLYLSQGGAYAVYHSRYESLNYITPGEYRIKLQLDKILNNHRANMKLTDCLIIANNDIFADILASDLNRNQSKFSNLEMVYDNIYGLTLDNNGQKLMQLMSVKGWQQQIFSDFEISSDSTSKLNVECDSYDAKNDIYTFLFCIPNLKRFRQFVRRAEMVCDKTKFRVICFDFQKDLVAKACINYCKIFTTPIDEYVPDEYLTVTAALHYDLDENNMPKKHPRLKKGTIRTVIVNSSILPEQDNVRCTL